MIGKPSLTVTVIERPGSLRRLAQAYTNLRAQVARDTAPERQPVAVGTDGTEGGHGQ